MKRLFTLATMLLCSLLSFAQFSGSGNGTEEDPYLIFNETQLAQVSNFLNQEGVVFKLMKDLDISEWIAENNPRQGWLPIGVESMPFKGSFLGNNHKVSGLMIKRVSTDYVGFFGYLSGATIENLSIEGTSVTGASNVGGFIGYAAGSEITNCNLSLTSGVEGTSNVGGFIGQSLHTNYSTFSVETSVSAQNYLGGFVGLAEGGTWQQGSVTGQSTNAENYAGGFAGKLTSVSITDIKQIGDVSGLDYTGGFVGCCSTGTFIRCSVESNVQGTQYVSGFSGALENTTSSFNTCFHKGTITASGDYAGGIVGVSKGGCIEDMENCSHFGDMQGNDYVGGLIGAVLNIAVEPTLHYYYRDYWQHDDVYYYERLYSGSSVVRLIKNCNTVGNIIANSFVGGLIGSASTSKSFSAQSHYEGSALETIIRNGNVTQRTCHYYSDVGKDMGTTLTYYDYYRNTISLSIENNYFSGTIQGQNNAGGIVGYNSGGIIHSNYMNANIYGSKNVGGIVGQISGDTDSNYSNYTTIKSNVAIVSTISATTSNVGRIYGLIDEEYTTIGALGSSESNRALAQARVILSGVAQDIDDDLQNGTSIGPSALKLKANYVSWGWNFDDNWNILETECFPYKKYQAAPPIIESNLVSQVTSISGKSVDGGTVYLYYKDRDVVSTESNNYFWSFDTEPLQSGAIVQIYADVEGKAPSYFTTATVGYPGSGTEEDPWRIYTAEDLQGASNRGYYKVMNDIDLTQWINENSPEKGWIPIGRNSGDATYIDGSFHTISGLWINTTDDYNGLFSNFSSGQIKNLNVEVATGKSVKGGDYTGILIGRNANGIIENCYVKGDVEGTVHVGGVVGYTLNTTINKVSFEGSAMSSSNEAFVGGLAGMAEECNLDRCRTDATVTSTNAENRVGGLVGYSKGGTISKSVANTTLSTSGSNGYAGGLVGYSESAISQSVSTGNVSVTGNDSYTGGLVGYALSPIDNCYSTTGVKGTLFSAGLVGYTFNSIDKCYATGNIEGVMYGGGVVGELDGANASLTNSVAACNILSLSAQSSWGCRVIGGFKNGAADPDLSNYALSTMQVSLNNVPQRKTDDLVEGIAKTMSELMNSATYQGLGWDFSSVWGINHGENYPFLLWNDENTPVAGISFDKTTLIIAIGSEETITASVMPLGATNKQLSWTSSNEEVATVENGVVTAVAVGTAIITASATDGSGVTANCQVTVTANKEAAIAALQALVDEAQTLYDNSTEGEDIGEYAPGSRAALLAVINSVRAQISSTMSDEAINQCTADINAAIEAFESQKVTASEDTDYGAIANTIYLERVEGAAGSQVTLSVKMKNTVEVQGYQFDLYLPEGVTVATDEDGFSLIELSTERTTTRKTDYFNSTVQADGSIRVLCGSSKGYTFDGNDGEVATITLNISEDMEEGDYPIILKEVNLTDKNSTLYTTAYLKSTLSIINFILGDVNGNKKVEVADFIATANYILGNPPQVFIFKAGDLNNNKNIEVSDFIGIANIILNSSTSSNAPAAAPKKGPRKAATDISTLTDIIYVEPVTATPGTQQTLSIQMKNSSPVAGFEFRLQLPEGITVATDDDDILMAELSTERTTARKTDYFNSALQADGTLQVLCGTSTANPNTGKPYTFSGNEGEVARITVNIPEDYADGVYEMNILDAAFSDADNNLTEVGQTVTTELTIGDNTIVLDEDSEDDIETTDAAVNIRVRRTIAANQWSTICLPFNMTAEQVYASFGDDVQLQAFDSYDVDYDDDDNVKSILVHFGDIDIDEEGFYANYPYLIKVSEPVEEFTVRSILEPDEESAIAEYDNGKTGRQRKVYGTFYGTYHAQTTVPESCLFISNNKFWYSTGLTKMKAFRGYFEFVDVLADMANANISFSFDGTTGIREINREQMADGAVYTIQGQFVGKDIDLKKLPRGIYIINGKKQVIK
ncbi:MAG: Ig-like domain-containing protein [Prevotella sp.]|nr:Ig-like domain-containing protein [Prevotella sp.]